MNRAIHIGDILEGVSDEEIEALAHEVNDRIQAHMKEGEPGKRALLKLALSIGVAHALARGLIECEGCYFSFMRRAEELAVKMQTVPTMPDADDVAVATSKAKEWN